MRCTAILPSGRPCRRNAEPHSNYCHLHDQERGSFYGSRLSNSEQQALVMAAHIEGVDGEIAMLRVLIRRVAVSGDIDAARRGIDALCRTLRARHELDAANRSPLSSTLERVLDALGEELCA